MTPAVAPRTAPGTAFSAARAMQHLEEIAREPHPIGSPANARVRDYLVAQLRSLGLDTQVQTTTAVQDLPEARLGAVQNVVARLKGMQPGPAIMLTAHYDSVAISPGASDDGAAVAAMLETARALIAGPSLQHDVLSVRGLIGGFAAFLLSAVLSLVVVTPKPTSLMYRLNADTGKAEWISRDEAPDNWTAQFLREHVEHRPFELVEVARVGVVDRRPEQGARVAHAGREGRPPPS